MDQSGSISPGDVTNFVGRNGPPALAVNGDLTGQDITLTAFNSAPYISTLHVHPASGSDIYNIGVGINIGKKQLVSMTLISGNNVAVPYDMTADTNFYNDSYPVYNNSVIPAKGDTYQFLVIYSDGSSEIISSTVTGVISTSEMAQSLAVNTSSPYYTTVPQLTWAAPSSPLPSFNYKINLYNTNNAQEN